jgi:hypothetical protein
MPIYGRMDGHKIIVGRLMEILFSYKLKAGQKLTRRSGEVSSSGGQPYKKTRGEHWQQFFLH